MNDAPELHVNNDYEESYQYALRLADALRKKHYPDNTDWRPLGDLLGLLTQIDNMVADLCAPTDERVARLVDAAKRVREDFEDMREVFDGLASSTSVTTWAEMDPCGPMDAWMEGERLLRAALRDMGVK